MVPSTAAHGAGREQHGRPGRRRRCWRRSRRVKAHSSAGRARQDSAPFARFTAVTLPGPSGGFPPRRTLPSRAGIAQLAEQLTRNEQARGSSPLPGSKLPAESYGGLFPTRGRRLVSVMTSPPASGRRLSRYERVAFPDGGLPVSPRRGRASCRSSPGSGVARPRRCSSRWSASSAAAGTAVWARRVGPARGVREQRELGDQFRERVFTEGSNSCRRRGRASVVRRSRRRADLATRSAADHRGRARPRQAGLERVAGVLAQARSPVGGDRTRPGEGPVPPRRATDIRMARRRMTYADHRLGPGPGNTGPYRRRPFQVRARTRSI